MKILVEIAGCIGTILNIGAYLLLERRKITSKSISYPMLNLTGSILLGIVGIYSKSVSIISINVCWVLISVSLLISNIKRRNNDFKNY